MGGTSAVADSPGGCFTKVVEGQRPLTQGIASPITTGQRPLTQGNTSLITTGGESSVFKGCSSSLPEGPGS